MLATEAFIHNLTPWFVFNRSSIKSPDFGCVGTPNSGLFLLFCQNSKKSPETRIAEPFVEILVIISTRGIIPYVLKQGGESMQNDKFKHSEPAP
jgi:hypothetical protein